MILRFVLIGAESTGKSHLAEKLADHFGVPASDEFVREFVKKKGAAVSAEDVYAILEGQRKNEGQLLEQCNFPFVIHDTNVLSTAVYARELYGIDLALHRDEFAGPDFFYLLCFPDIPWKPDPDQRDSPESRAHFHRCFIGALEHHSLPFAAIRGSGNARLQNAIAAIRARCDQG